jgi:hypothetical protein
MRGVPRGCTLQKNNTVLPFGNIPVSKGMPRRAGLSSEDVVIQWQRVMAEVRARYSGMAGKCQRLTLASGGDAGLA